MGAGEWGRGRQAPGCPAQSLQLPHHSTHAIANPSPFMKGSDTKSCPQLQQWESSLGPKEALPQGPETPCVCSCLLCHSHSTQLAQSPLLGTPARP